MLYARVEHGTVFEIIESDDIKNSYHPDFIVKLIECSNSVKVGMIFIDGVFVEQSEPTRSHDELITEQLLMIDTHIQTCIKSKDYDDIGQVALCCTDGSGYQIEALAVSDWIRKCWAVQEKIKAGIKKYASADDAIAALPAFDIYQGSEHASTNSKR